MIKTFLPLLMNSKGKIVITSSVAGVLAIPFLGAYSDTKAALISLSRSLRTELEPFNIQVCCTITGGVDTHSQAVDSKFPDGEF
jgi:1-acylglycerone phosphate reductase